MVSFNELEESAPDKKKPTAKERPKYKGVKFKNEQGLDRKIRIANCATCKGNPIKEPLHLAGMSGEKCATCMEVIHYTIL
jgi:hypothetical protein